jgi:predicted nucleotidyltransferase component of viral defense system
MADEIETWRSLFQHALVVMDDARSFGLPVDDWTFGGGTVLMRRHHHRFSKDVDIFINDPQFLGYLSPRLSPAAEKLTGDYVEADMYVKLRFPEGEVDFIASQPLTESPADVEVLFERPIRVEKSAEIVAKKIWHRGAEFTARDIFDFAMVAEKEPEALNGIGQILRDRRAAVLARIETHGEALRETFEQLRVLDYNRTFDQCVETTRSVLDRLR